MTTDETPEEKAETSSRAAGGCVAVVGFGVAGAVVYAVPELGYTVAGILATVGARKARNWAIGRRQHTDETVVDEQEPVDIVAVLQELGEGGQNVLLTRLREAASVPDTKAVRVLLDEAGIPIRSGVRTPRGNGPGVHHENIPREGATPSERCLCRSHANANTNNEAGEGSGKGLRVEHTGQAGVTVYDLSETQSRHHATAQKG